jgi:H+-transporting ATPase
MRIRNFIIYRVAATLQLLTFFFIAVFIFHPSSYQPSPNPDDTNWPDFFHMPVLMLMLITLLNDGTLIAIGYDRVQAPKTPVKWNLRAIFTIAGVLAGVAMISSLILVEMSLDSWNTNGFYQKIGIGGLSYGQVTTSVYLKVAVSDFLTLFSSRTGGDWFWTEPPARLLGFAAAFAITMSLILALSWPASYPDGIYTIGLARRSPYALFLWIIAYCVFWWFIQDAAKVGTYYMMQKYNTFGVNDNGCVVIPESTKAYIEKYRRDAALRVSRASRASRGGGKHH